MADTIYLAGGCFWGLQKYFDLFSGVLRTEVGYANGPDRAPSYEDVCADSGHAETVKIEYDRQAMPLEKLLDAYFLVIEAGAKLAVTVEPLKNFFSAEEYHQKYLEKNPGGYCHIPDRFYHREQEG